MSSLKFVINYANEAITIMHFQVMASFAYLNNILRKVVIQKMFVLMSEMTSVNLMVIASSYIFNPIQGYSGLYRLTFLTKRRPDENF